MPLAVVKLIDHVIPGDPDRTEKECDQRGDIVTIVPDGYIRQNKVTPDKFGLVPIGGQILDLQYLKMPKLDHLQDRVGRAAMRDPAILLRLDQVTKPKIKTWRRFRVDLSTGQVVDKEKP